MVVGRWVKPLLLTAAHDPLAQISGFQFYRPMVHAPLQFLKLQAIERMRCRWRTRPTPEGWEAQCEAGTSEDNLIAWLSKGDTEQVALDKAVDNA